MNHHNSHITYTLSLSHTHTYTHTLSLSLTHTHTHTLSLSHTHSHTLTFHTGTHCLPILHKTDITLAEILACLKAYNPIPQNWALFLRFSFNSEGIYLQMQAK